MFKFFIIGKGRAAQRKSVNMGMAEDVVVNQSLANYHWPSQVVDKPVVQYDTTANELAGRQLADFLLSKFQFTVIGLHCTKRMTTKAIVEVTSRATVAMSRTLSLFCIPVMRRRKRVMEILTKHTARRDKNSEKKRSWLARMS